MRCRISVAMKVSNYRVYMLSSASFAFLHYPHETYPVNEVCIKQSS